MENYQEYGLEAEKVVLSYLQDMFNFEIKHNILENYIANFSQLDDVFPPSQQELDRIKIRNIKSRVSSGDVIIETEWVPLKFNVVRGTFLKHKAIEGYNGHFYCFFPGGDISDPGKARIVLQRTVSNYRKTCLKNKRQDEQIEQATGFRYNGIKAYLTLEEFTLHLMKLIIMSPQTGKEFYYELRRPFIEKYKKILLEEQ